MSHRAVSPNPAVSKTRRRASRLRRSAASMAVLNLLALALNHPAQAMNACWAGREGNWMSNIAWVGGLVPTYLLHRVFIDDLINPPIASKVHLNTSVGVRQVFIGADGGIDLANQSGFIAEGGALNLYPANGYTLGLNDANAEVIATVTGVSAVPKPQTWALWLGGRGAVAAVARRRQTQRR